MLQQYAKEVDVVNRDLANKQEIVDLLNANYNTASEINLKLLLKADTADIILNYPTNASLNTKLLDYATVTVVQEGFDQALAQFSSQLALYWRKYDIEQEFLKYALITTLPNMNLYALQTQLPDMSLYALKTDIPITGEFITNAQLNTWLALYYLKADGDALTTRFDNLQIPSLYGYALLSDLEPYALKT